MGRKFGADHGYEHPRGGEREAPKRAKKPAGQSFRVRGGFLGGATVKKWGEAIYLERVSWGVRRVSRPVRSRKKSGGMRNEAAVVPTGAHPG